MKVNYLKPFLVGNQLISNIKKVSNVGIFEKDEYGEEICINPQLNNQELNYLYSKTSGKAWNSSGINPEFYSQVRKLLQHKEIGKVLSSKNQIEILDYGSGGTLLLETIQKFYPLTNCIGFDIGKQSVDIKSKNLRMEKNFDYNSWLDKSNKRFDLIFLMSVYEHVDDIDTLLIKLRLSLKDKGLLIIETGDSMSIWARLTGDKWHYRRIHEHIRISNRVSILRRLKCQGFSSINIMTNIEHRLIFRWRTKIKKCFKIILNISYRVISIFLRKNLDEQRINMVVFRDHMIIIAAK